VKGVAIHWVGSGLSEALRKGDNGAVAAFLRQCHSNNVRDGYSLAVDGKGDVWECRGLTQDTAANGTEAANNTYVSILVIYPVGGKPTDIQIKGVQHAIKRVREKYPSAKAIRPHQFFVPTACPGPAALQLIKRGGFEPGDGSGNRDAIRKLRDALDDLGHRGRKLAKKIKELLSRKRRVEKARDRKRKRLNKLS
jgi:hypothetical protein